MARSLLATSLGLYVLFSVVMAGLLTNWFRYLPSLEDWFVLLPILFVGVLVVVLHILALRSPTPTLWRVGVPLICAAAGVGVILASMKLAHGRIVSWDRNHDERNGVQTLTSNGTVLSYYLELENPFAEKPSAQLVVVEGGRRLNIPIPLFGSEKTVAVVTANKPSDWCVLQRNSDSRTFLLETTGFLRKAQFVVDLEQKRAAEVGVRR